MVYHTYDAKQRFHILFTANKYNIELELGGNELSISKCNATFQVGLKRDKMQF